MRLSSKKETYDSNPPSGSSSRTLINGGIRRRPSNETIESYQGSISNDSIHTVSTVHTDRDQFDLSGQDSFISDHKSLHSFEKSTRLSRNQSLSTIRTIRESESESDSDSTSPSPPKQESSSLSLHSLEDEAEISFPPNPRSPQAIAPTRVEAPSHIPSPVFVAHPPLPLSGPLMKPYGDSQLFASTGISTTDTPSIRPTSFLPPPTDHIGTASHSRSDTDTLKRKKATLDFMAGFRESDKLPEVSAPYGPVHVQHVDLDSITGKLTVLLGNRHEFSQNSRIFDADQEKNLPAAVESPRILGMASTVYPEESKSVDDSLIPTGMPTSRSSQTPSDGSNLVLLPLPKTSHSSSDTQVVSTTHTPPLYLPFPSLPPAQPNLDGSNSQRSIRSILKPPRSDALVRGNATGDRRSPGPELQASVEASLSNSPVTERRAQPTTSPQQQSAVVASLAKTVGATPRRREKRKENKPNDANLMKRLQQICKGADPTRLYRNLVKTGQG